MEIYFNKICPMIFSLLSIMVNSGFFPLFCPKSHSIWLHARQICHHHQHIHYKDSHNPEQAENLLPKEPALLVLHPFEKEISKWVDGRLARKAIINGLVILVRFEPEFVRVRKEQQAEEQKQDDEAERGSHTTFLPRRDTKEVIYDLRGPLWLEIH
jgi:hypothetical protein